MAGYTIPKAQAPLPCPLSVNGNNAAVACPCGRVIVVRSMNRPGTGAWECQARRQILELLAKDGIR